MPQPKRPYWRKQDAERVFAELQASGLSTAAFARRHAIAPAKLHRWRTRLGSEPSAAAFIPVVADCLVPPAGSADVELVLGDGVLIRVPRGFCAQTLSRLLVVLGAETPC